MNYHKITKFDTSNGPGVRVTLWVSGCNHHCKGCHNPETWDVNSGNIFNTVVLSELIDSLAPDYISGLTLSGGDPLHPLNRYTISVIVSTIKTLYPSKSIWLYTGYKWEDIIRIGDTTTGSLFRILEHIDVLVDGEYKESCRDITLPYCGSTNQRLIDVQKTMYSRDIVLYELDN